MVDESERLISEVQQIKTQYVAEVGRGRRIWPRSIKERVARLDDLGLPARAVSKQTGISYETVILWRHKRRKEGATPPAFHEIGVSKNLPAISKSVAVTVPRIEMPVPTVAIRLTTPNGFVIEGLDENTVVRLISTIGGKGGGDAS